jgi:aryl-alcohol dehydrogenase-like predicted oxidoreductase
MTNEYDVEVPGDWKMDSEMLTIDSNYPIMAALSSAQPETHQDGLNLFRHKGGSMLHLHGEGGETHSRKAAGEWLNQHDLRSQFTVCTQICHDDWDEANQSPIVRFTPEGAAEDIAADLQLIRSSYVDVVYLDDHSELPFEPIIEFLAAEVRAGRIRHIGVRNWLPERLKALCSFANTVLPNGIEALVTTELSLLTALSPLWPEYVPFDDQIAKLVRERNLVVFVHCSDITTGQCLFGDDEPVARFRAHWVERWQQECNKPIVENVVRKADTFCTTPRAILLAWMLSRPFRVVPIVGAPDLLRYDADYQVAITNWPQIWVTETVPAL